jgi:hypothetical protein
MVACEWSPVSRGLLSRLWDLTMMSRCLTIVLLLSCVACSKSSSPGPTTPTPSATRVLRLGGNLVFGTVPVGDVRTDGILVINNDGNATLTVSGISSPSSVYTLNWTNGTIAPGASQTVGIRFAPTAEQNYSGTLTVNGDQTSGTNTIAVEGAGTLPPRRGNVTDPTGDARNPRPSPDLADATLEISGGTFTITVSFAPGTLSTQDVLCIVSLDTDENQATGDVEANGLRGADYQIYFVRPRASALALVYKVGTNSSTAPTVPVTFPSANQARVSFPMSLLGNDDGRMAFNLFVRQWVNDNGTTATLDTMPDAGLPAAVTR